MNLLINQVVLLSLPQQLSLGQKICVVLTYAPVASFDLHAGR